MKRYRAAVNYFVFVTIILFGSVAETYETLDEQLVYFLELLWTEGETKSLAGDTICGIQHHLNCRRTFPGAWRFFTAWKKAELPQRTPPLTWLMLLGIAGALDEMNRLDVAGLIIMAFHALLRTSEMIQICPGHVMWTGQARGVLFLPLTKSGQRAGTTESVTLLDPFVRNVFMASCSGRDPLQPVLKGNDFDFRKTWAAALLRVGLDPGLYKPYSLRRGGASHHYMEGMSITETQHRGRWGAYRTAKIYIVEGQREVSEAGMSENARSLCVHASSRLRRFL